MVNVSRDNKSLRLMAEKKMEYEVAVLSVLKYYLYELRSFKYDIFDSYRYHTIILLIIVQLNYRSNKTKLT